MLLLGPIVGHTTGSSALVWIRASRPASEYGLRIPGVGLFSFAPTGANAYPYGTAIAIAEGLRPDWRYRYQVLYRGRVLGRSHGRFRTMPPRGSWSPVLAVIASCSKNDALGAWPDLARFVRDIEPHAIFFIGDQVYHDQVRPGTGDGGVWVDYLNGRLSSHAKLREALAETYQHCWSRPEIAEVLKSCPSYMMWDDHDIRDGWGSWASDSPTIAARNRRAAKVCAVDDAYFQAAREVAWHFQLCRNPRTYPRAAANGQDLTATEMPAPGVLGVRTTFGFAIEVGRAAFVVIDSRGNRDLWRDSAKVLGAAQWKALEGYVDRLSRDVDAVVFLTPVPIVATGPNSISQSLFQGRQDDVKLVEAGRDQELRRFQLKTEDFRTAAALGIAVPLSLAPGPFTPAAARNLAGRMTNARHEDLDDVRDQWSNEHSRPEQERLIHLTARARTSNRPGAIPRSVMFAGGDLHVGARFTVDVEGNEIPCLISSGLSQEIKATDVPFTLDEAFEVSRGIRATAQGAVNVPNFGMVSINPATQPAQLALTLVQQSGREASALKLGGYVINGDPVPDFVRRIVRRPKNS